MGIGYQEIAILLLFCGAPIAVVVVVGGITWFLTNRSKDNPP